MVQLQQIALDEGSATVEVRVLSLPLGTGPRGRVMAADHAVPLIVSNHQPPPSRADKCRTSHRCRDGVAEAVGEIGLSAQSQLEKSSEIPMRDGAWQLSSNFGLCSGVESGGLHGVAVGVLFFSAFLLQVQPGGGGAQALLSHPRHEDRVYWKNGEED